MSLYNILKTKKEKRGGVSMHKSIFIVFIVLAFVSVGVAQATVCPSTNVIEDPAPFDWTQQQGYNEGTLEIGEASFIIDGETLTTRAYRQEGGSYSIPGPTMYMTPGETYVLTFKNTLPFAEPSPVHNDLKDPNITNIHTHGLHVSGETPADDVTRLINGGYCGDYVYEVPANHMGGSLWYHAHHHGSTWLQVAGGAFGMLIIDDTNDVCLPGEVDPCVPVNVAGMTERLLAVGYLDPAGVAGNGGDTLISGTLSSTWTVNGLVEGNLCTPANEWQHWRVLIADPDARKKTVTIGPGCEAVLMARDGVWRTVAPLALVDNEIVLTGASRADLAVRCSADSTITVDNTVVANIYADSTLPTNQNPDVGPYSDGATGTTWSASRPNYLPDLRGEAVDDARKISMGARSVNGEKFDADVSAFDILPGIQEWDIKGATNHPFHLHVYHQQVQEDCGGAFEAGEYYDTIAGSCLVRLEVNPETGTAYDGRTIMHCHILEHEDQGAMIWADTIGGFPPPILPAGKQVLYQCDGGPPICEPTEPVTELTCNDGLDNDCDGDIDLADTDCQEPVVCSDITKKNLCNDEPSCTWNRNNRACEPI
jgi:FtsP/CotA-like multicopper oxidase with cupredoxin domain